MPEKDHGHFYFHALGHAFSAKFTRPITHSIEAQAATSLPTIGGHANSRVENFKSHHFVSFHEAHTHVSGSFQDEDKVVTEATTSIEGLNILNFITADRIVARLTSEYIKGKKEAHIIALGSHFDNLRLGGHLVKVIFRHNIFLECPVFEDLRKLLAADKNSGKVTATEDGVALCSLVEKIETDLPGAQIRGHIIKVPHFGEISLAQVFATPGTRILTMIKLRLGSPNGGQSTTAEAMVEGQPPPPTG